MNTIVNPTAQDEICYFCWEQETETNKFIHQPICECKGSLKLHWNCYRILDDFRQQESDINDLDNLFREYLIDDNMCKICMTHYTLNVEDDCFYSVTYHNGCDYHIIYNLNGTIAEEGTTDSYGYKHGFWKIYNNGRLIKKGIYSHGLLNGTWKFYDEITAHLKSEGHFENNLQHGTWKYYYPSGQLKEEGTYIYSLQHGDWKKYYESGHLESEGTYENGQKMEDWKTYPDTISGKKRKASRSLEFEPIAKRLRSSSKNNQ